MFINSPGFSPDSDTVHEKYIDYLWEQNRSVDLGLLAHKLSRRFRPEGRPRVIRQIVLESKGYRSATEFRPVRSLQVASSLTRPGEEILVTGTSSMDTDQLVRLIRDISILNPLASVSGPDLSDFYCQDSKSVARVDLKKLAGSQLTYLTDRGLHRLYREGDLDLAGLMEIHREFHRAGIKTAITWDFSLPVRDEKFRNFVHQSKKLHALTGGILAFIPYGVMCGYGDYLTLLAVARLYLSQLTEFRVSAQDAGAELSQMSLMYGADTLLDDLGPDLSGSGACPCESIVKNLYKKEYSNPESSRSLSDSGLPALLNQIRESLVLDKNKGLQVEQLVNDREDYYGLQELLTQAETGKKVVSYASVVDVQVRDVNRGGRPPDFSGYILGRMGSGDLQNHDLITVNLDLAGSNKSGEDINLHEFYSLLGWFEERPQYEVTVSGIRGFWRLVQNAKISLGEAFQTAARMGVKTFQSSVYETEGGLTLSELRNLHYAAHEHGLLTVPKVELVVPPWGGRPLWAAFIQRLLSFVLLDRESGGIPACSIEVARDSSAPFHEYLKALSLARILSPEKIRVVSVAGRFPLMGRYPAIHKNSPEFQGKLARLVVNSGADDLGFLPIHKIDPIPLVSSLAQNGLALKERTAGFDTIRTADESVLH